MLIVTTQIQIWIPFIESLFLMNLLISTNYRKFECKSPVIEEEDLATSVPTMYGNVAPKYFIWSTSGDTLSEARMDFANEILLFKNFSVYNLQPYVFLLTFWWKFASKKKKKEHCMEPDWVHKWGPEVPEFEKMW
jgi:hypothetical protein